VDLGAGEGVSVDEQETADTLSTALLLDAGVAAVFWREQGGERYVVRTPGTTAAFTRARDADGDLTLAWEGESPLRDDPMADPDLATALSHGNPQGTAYPAQGYDEGDPRLSFPTMEDASYPRLMRRISQIFDSPSSPDMGIALAPYANGGIGSHGSMSLAQSRAPLVLRGPGVKPGSYALAADHVDIAPTVAGLLGVDPVGGVDGSVGRWVEGQMLKWQDGRVLDEVLVEDCAHGAAPRAVVIILDGMNHAELLDGVAEGRAPNLGRILDAQAAVLEGGAITGWPTFSLPGHYSVHTGTYQGHHRLLSNSFEDRSTGESAPGIDLSAALADPVAGAAALEAYLSSEVETIFEAVARTFPDAVTATINELTFRGASWSPLETGGPPPPPSEGYLAYSLADEAAVLRVAYMLDEVGPPTYMALSLYLPDAAGQGEGPHGDGLRENLVQTDERVGRILDLYEEAGAFEDTLWVLTADHGMELQDTARTSGWSGALSGTGVSTSSHGRMVVFH
jgi:hypothetical protein